MNFLITGGLGFIGSNFVNYYLNKYPDVKIVILDKQDYCSSLLNIDTPAKIIIGNILDEKLVKNILYDEQIDTIIHFAAESHVDNSFNNSLSFTLNNTLGTHSLLEVTRLYHQKTNNIKLFCHVSTDEIYGEVNDDIVRTETSTPEPSNIYASSKLCAEYIVKSYYKLFKLPIIITRANNIYGPNQYPEKVIPKFICQLLNNEKMTIHGNGSGKRNFIHVKDVCDAYDIIIHKGKIGEIYNISASENNEFSVLEIATMLIALMNVDPNLIEYVDDRIFNDCRYYTSSEKLKNLGWHPVHVNFKENVLDLISWYKINKDRYL